MIAALIGAAPDIANTTRDAAWRPVTVTAFLADPLIGPGLHPVHLDGPLAWAAYLAWTDAHGTCALPPPGETVTDFSLPLATWTSPAPPGADPAALTGDGLAWGWACSRAIIPVSAIPRASRPVLFAMYPASSQPESGGANGYASVA